MTTRFLGMPRAICSFALVLSLPLHGAEVVRVKPLPITPAQNPSVVDERFGIKVVDEDRWLEDTKDPRVEQWYRDQNTYTRKVMDSIPGRARLLQRIKELEKSSGPQFTQVPYLMGDGRMLLVWMVPGASSAKLYVRDGWEGADRMLLDPDEWTKKTGKPHGIDFAVPSPDGRYAVVGVSASGSESGNSYIVDLHSGKRSAEVLPDIPVGRMRWLPDSHALAYVTDPKIGGKENYDQIRLHVLGTSPSKDKLLFGAGAKEIPVDAQATSLRVAGAPDSPWLLAQTNVIKEGKTSYLVYAARIDRLMQERIGWREVIGAKDGFEVYELKGDDLYVLRSDAPGSRIERRDLNHPESQPISFWKPGNGVLSSLSRTEDDLIATVIPPVGVGTEQYRVPFNGGAEKRIELAGFETILDISNGPSRRDSVLGASGWSKFARAFRVDGNGALHPANLIPLPTGFDDSAIHSRVVEVQSHDGVKVPLSIRWSGAAEVSPRPFLLEAYGNFGTSGTAFLQPSELLEFELGLGRAYCHTRGGGEKGESWHEGAYLATKPNAWKDLIACAAWLVENSYTTPRQLAIYGASGGGVLIGNAVIDRPDLFAAAIPQVGVLDTIGSALRDKNNGLTSVAEYGDPETHKGWPSLVATSAYQKIKAGTHYPAMLVQHGWNDARVPVWNSGKFAARMQRGSSSQRPVLLSIDFDGGHGPGAGADAQARRQVDLLSFTLWQIGVPEFQPTWQDP